MLRFDTNVPEIGLYTRKTKQGLESELVEQFYSILNETSQSNKAVFIEPKIGTSFPDIVMVDFSPKSYQSWNDNRASLQTNDLKILNYFYQSKSAQSIDLIRKLGFKSNDVLKSLELLLDCDLIERKNESWTIKKNNVFGLKSIKAFEAKISNLSQAFKQANLNKWFASESYVITSVKNPTNTSLETSKEFGVGLYSLEGKTLFEQSSADKKHLPLSYASWYFNEWLGRYFYHN